MLVGLCCLQSTHHESMMPPVTVANLVAPLLFGNRKAPQSRAFSPWVENETLQSLKEPGVELYSACCNDASSDNRQQQRWEVEE